MTDLVLLSRDGDIATVALNRGERMNAFNLAMWDSLQRVMAEVNGDDSLRCVVLRGAGEAPFGAGADIAEFETVRADAAQARAYARRVDAAMAAVADCPWPTLAMIRGACVGGGLELAVNCDLRICGADARFGIPINRIGHCLPMPAMRALVELVGRSVALEVLLEGRIINACEAKDIGLVNRVVPDEELAAEAGATAERIARGAPLAARGHKRLAHRALDPRPLSEQDWAAAFETCDSADYREGVRAFLAKEQPVFKGR
jgi:enoyl-CoA hydratase/carnithine racemase